MKKPKLSVEIVESSADIARFDNLLRAEHKLAATPSVGDFLRLVAVRDGQWVALLAWGPCCYALQDRDDWIGWSRTFRAIRQKLVVQLRRLLVPEATREPNLASQALGAVVRELPALWEQRFGYRPVLAETFSDREVHAGTCYRAAGWLPVGESKGYARHRADFYREHGRPKRLWLKPLQADAKEILCAPVLPQAQLDGGHSAAAGVLPLTQPQNYSLAVALRQVKDPRGKSTTFRSGPLLCIVAMALLSGCRDVSEIHRFGQRLKPKQRQAIGLPKGPGKGYWMAPGYNVYYQFLRRLDLDQFGQVLTAWLQTNAGSLPSSLARDGKMIRELIGVLSLVDHETGVPVAIAYETQKNGDGAHCELNVARKTLRDNPRILDGALVTGDALHADRDEVFSVTDSGGDYLFQIRENKPKLRRLALRQTQGHTPFLPSAQSPKTDISSPIGSPSTPQTPCSATSPAPARSCASPAAASTSAPGNPSHPSVATSSPVIAPRI